MTAIPPPEERFYSNMLSLSGFLYEIVTKVSGKGINVVEPGVVLFVNSVISTYDKHDLIINYIHYSHQHWDSIKKRDENFFDEKALDIFKGLPTKHIEKFQNLFRIKSETGEHIVPKEDRDCIWEYFESFTKIAIRYVLRGRKRNPRFLSNILTDIQSHANKWSIKD